MSRKYVRTIEDCPEASILLKKLKFGSPAVGFSIRQSGNHLHFSRPVLTDVIWSDVIWSEWVPTTTQVRLLIKALTGPAEDLPRLAVWEPDYDYLHLKFGGHVRVPTAKTIAREIAIARLEGKL